MTGKLNAVITLDFLARRYSATPTEILQSGTTFDLYVAETAAGYEAYQRKVQSGDKHDNKGLSVERMQGMLNTVRTKDES